MDNKLKINWDVFFARLLRIEKLANLNVALVKYEKDIWINLIFEPSKSEFKDENILFAFGTDDEIEKENVKRIKLLNGTINYEPLLNELIYLKKIFKSNLLKNKIQRIGKQNLNFNLEQDYNDEVLSILFEKYKLEKIETNIQVKSKLKIL